MKRFFTRIPRSLLYVVIFLIVLRLLLPSICLWGFNWALQNKGEIYTGHLDDFDLSLYRGAYQLQGLEIRKKGVNIPPLITARQIDLSIAWRGLLQKKFLIDATLDQVAIHLVDSNEKAEKQSGLEEKEPVRKNFFDLIFPVSIESLKATNSAIYFTNNSFKKALPVSLEKVDLVVENLRTHEAKELSPFVLYAILQKHAPLAVRGNMDVMSESLRMDVNWQLVGFNVPTINDVLRIYVPLDITKGKLDVYSEVALANKNGEGYFNVFLDDADIIASNQHFISLKHFFYEIIVAVGNWLLENPKDHSLAFHMPFRITNGKISTDTSEVLSSAIENRFGKMQRGIDHSIHLKISKGKQKKEE